MKKSSFALIVLVATGTSIVVTYNACSVRRTETATVTGAQSNASTASPSPSPSSSSSSTSTAPSLLIAAGSLKLMPAGQALNLPLNGRIMMVRNYPSMKTDVYTHLNGGATSPTKYDIHVHNQPCALGGGAHYKIDNKIATAMEENEIWPAVTTGVDGAGSGFKSIQHLVRPDGQSVVVHAADGSRIACGDLSSQASVSSKSGRFVTLNAGKNLPISGAAVIIRNANANQTVVKARIAGLSPNTTYTAHVHAQACATGEGGAHYKMNPAVTEMTPSAANEFWLTLATNASGFAEARVEADHVARADAMSIVIHDPVTPANRLACVDLATEGGFISTEAGLQKKFNILGTGSIDRLTNGSTMATVSVSGLAPNTSYIPHVHDRPCHVSAGGGHYKIDYSISAASETNEIWPRFTTDSSGSGVGAVTVQHLARPEAQSIVIHDPTDSARIACMDIY